MSVRNPLRVLVVIAALASCSATVAADNPNVVYVLADDLGDGDPGCYNAKSKIPTPNIDRLAKEGVRFTDAHSPSAVSTPTRFALLTGRYAWRTKPQRNGIGRYSQPLIAEKRFTVPAMLREQGTARRPPCTAG